jgi:integrase
MARKTKGNLFIRGKNKYYYLQYYLNGKQIVKALRDEKDNPITRERVAQKAADVIMAPYRARDKVQLRQQSVDALKSAEDKAVDAERVKHSIKLTNAFNFAIDKPRRRPLGEKAKKQKETHWNDFLAYMTAEHPEVTTLNGVSPVHAEGYIQHITHKGKFDRAIVLNAKKPTATYESKIVKLSPRSINCYITSCRDIFNCLKHKSRLEANPFMVIPKVKLVQEEREAFTNEELALISEKADDFIKPLFTIGLSTGLREADICLLKWNEINMESELIKRITRKTRKEVLIPILPPLMEFLQEQQANEPHDEYVLPEHAEMYLKNPSGISWRVKTFLESIDIATTKKAEGRSRAVSIKDVHSLRHSFCYYAGLYNIPLSVVQAVVGHMSSEMTKHYTMHADGNEIKKAFKNMPNLLATPGESKAQLTLSDEPERQQLRKLVDVLPIEDIKRILELINK